MTDKLISIQNLSKTYNDSFQALKNVSLDINKGEIFALLGPNGAGKTTLINIICGLVRPSSGSVMVNGADIIKDYKITRSQIGLVPQELTLEQFETVFQNVSYTRGLYGKSGNPTYIEKVLRDLSLWDKKKTRLGQLSGGMKRRVLIAKALSHEPSVLFLDEPTAGVDVELRQDMWRIVENLRQTGVTIILTTHYIEEAEAIADRVGVIDNGEMIVVDEKDALISKMYKSVVQQSKKHIKAMLLCGLWTAIATHAKKPIVCCSSFQKMHHEISYGDWEDQLVGLISTNHLIFLEGLKVLGMLELTVTKPLYPCSEHYLQR